jgi:hypothetical protein
MRLLRTKSETDRLLDTVGDSLAALSGSVDRSKLKVGLIAGGEGFVRQLHRARGVTTPATVGLTGAVDPRRRLSEGALVQASVGARLLGIPLLRLDATIVLICECGVAA